MRARFLVDVAWVGSGTVLSRGATVAGLMVVVRALSHRSFAAYAFGWAVYQVTSQLLSGFDLAYVDITSRTGRDDRLDATYLRMKIVGGCVLLAAGVAAVGLVRATGETSYWSVALAGVAAGCVFCLFQTNLSRHQGTFRFAAFGRALAFYNVAALVLTVLMILAGVRNPALLLAAYAVVGVPLLVRLRHFSAVACTRQSLAAFWRQSRWLVASGVLYGLALRAELLIGTALMAAAQLAIYAAPARAFALVEFSMATMGTVLLPHAASLRSQQQLRAYLWRGALVTFAFAVVGVVVGLGRVEFTTLVLGPHYVRSASLVPVFCLAAVLMSIYTSTKYLLFTIRLPGGFAAMNSTMLVVKAVAAVILIPALGPAGAAWCLVAAYAACTLGVAVAIGCAWPLVDEAGGHEQLAHGGIRVRS